MQRQRIILISAIAVALLAGFFGGTQYIKHQNAVAADSIIREIINKDLGKDSAIDFGLFWQVWDKLHESFVDQQKLDSQKLVYGAISGMVQAAGDPYTTFFEPTTSKKFQEEVSGAFSGVGMEIGMRGSAITVISPIKNSPAIAAGIRAGDIIITIDDTSTEGMDVDEAVSLIRGKKGTTVRLSIARKGAEQLVNFSIVRDTIRVPAVDWVMLPNAIAHLQVYSFNGNLDAEFALAVKEIQTAGARGIILDVRNNPGGLLDSAIYLAGWMLPSDSLVVQEQFSDGHIDQLRTTGNARLASTPITVLMNGGSASAAEILAGALHDIRGIELIGEKSFGKGSVQQLESFYNGSSLKVTVAKWLTPNGVSISETGIAPTIEVLMTVEDYEKNGWELGVPGKDPQLDRAVEVMQNR